MQTFGEYLKEKEKQNSAQRVKAYTPEEAERAKFAKWDEAVKQRRSEIRWENIGGDSYESYISDLSDRMSKVTDYKSAQALLPDVRTAIERTNQMQGWLNDFGSDEMKKTYDYSSRLIGLNGYMSDLEAERKRLRLDVPDAEDYAQYSKAGEGERSFFGLVGDETYDFINNRDGARLRAKATGQESLFKYAHMTDDQIGTYNYIYAKEGKEKAEEYLGLLEESLNDQEGKRIADNAKGNILATAGLAVESGLDQTIQGLRQFGSTLIGNEEALPTSPTQVASQIVQNDLKGGLGYYLYGAGQGVGQMLPSILLSTATGGLAGAAGLAPKAVSGISMGTGLLTQGASASGNAYQQAVQEGYDPDDAKKYALLVGASEAGLQYLLGGISKLGGVVVGKLGGSKIVSKASNVFNGFNSSWARIALKGTENLFGSAISEGGEEFLQELIEPGIAMFTLGKEYEVNMQDAIDAFFIGGLTGGVFEGRSSFTDARVQDAFVQMEGYMGGGKTDYFANVEDLSELTKRLEKLQKDSKHTADIDRQYAMRKAYYTGQEVAERIADGEDVNAIVTEIIHQYVPEVDSETIYNAFFDAKLENSTPEQIEAQRAKIEEGYFKSAGKSGQDFNTAQALYEATGLRTKSASQAYRAWATGQNEAKGAKKNAKKAAKAAKKGAVATAESAESQTFAELDDSEVRARTVANAAVKDASGERDVSVQAVEKVEDGRVTVRLEDGSTVNAETVDFEDGEVGTLYRASGGLSADAANRMIASYERTSQDAGDYANQFTTAYNYGRAGISTKELAADANLSGLTDVQKQVAYKLGREEALAERKASSERAKNARATGEKESGRARGRVRLEKGTEANSDIQRTSHKALQRLAAAIGVDFYLYESRVVNGRRVYIDEEGDETRANGWYDLSDGSIHLDVNAGAGGEGTILFTAAHELTHFIRDWSPEKFGVLADFLMEQYNEKGVPVRELIENQIAKAKKNGRELSFDEAYEEVIADSMETMLTDGKVLSELASRDRTLFEKIKDFISDLAKKVQALYKSMLPNSNEGRIVAEMSGALDRVQAMFTDALADASENYARGQKNNAREGVRCSERYQNAPINTDILSMVEQVQNGTARGEEKIYLGIVSDSNAERIYESTGIRVNGYKVIIEARQIVHILNDHGSNGAANQSMKDPNDIARMEYALKSPDDVRYGGKTEAYVSRKNGRNVRADTVLYEKKIGEQSYYVVQAVPNTSKKNLYIVSAFIGDSEYKKEAPQSTNAQGPGATSETESASASDKIIAQESDSVKRKFSDRDYTELETHFGTTRNYDVAGYLMTDGKMLDFSGRHWGDTSSDFRQDDHRDVYEVESIESEFDNGREAMVAMIGDGNIRLNPESGGINLAVLPNAKQMTALRGYINHFGGEVVVDVDDVGGDTIHSFEYNKGTSADRIIADIKGYFENGTIPEAQSELGQFRYSDRDEEADFSSRTLLANALESVARTPVEKERLAQYKSELGEIEKRQKRLGEVEAELRELQFAKGARNAEYHQRVKNLRDEKIRLNNYIHNRDRVLLSMESGKVLSDIVKREANRRTKELTKRNQDEYRKRTAEYVEARTKTERRRQIVKMLNDLRRRLVTPTKTQNIKGEYQQVVAMLLEAIDTEPIHRSLRDKITAYERQIKDQKAFVKELDARIEELLITEEDLKSTVDPVEARIRNMKEAIRKEKDKSVKAEKQSELDEYLEVNADALRDMRKVRFDLRQAENRRTEAKKKIADFEQEIQNLKAQEQEMTQAGLIDKPFSELRDLYSKIAREGGDIDPETGEYTDVLVATKEDAAMILEYIDIMRDKVKNTPWLKLNSEQVSLVYDTLRLVTRSMREADRVFTEAQNQVLSENGQKLMQQADSQGRVHKRTGIKGVDKGLDLVDTYTYGNDKPDTFFERLDCDVLRERQQALVKGQDTYAKDVKEGKTFFEKQANEHGYLKWDLDREVECTARNGKQFHIAIAEIMSLYAYSRDVESLDHIEKGGFTFMRTIKKVVEKNGKKKTIHVQRKETYNLSREQVAEICAKHLTNEQRAFVEKMQDYLSTVMGAKGNEVSLKRYGIKLFKKQFYFPIRTDKSYQAELNDSDGERKVINKGFTNSRKPHATSPIVLEGFMDVWARHVDEMSMYHGMALPLEDFSRIMNYTERGTVGGASATGVRESIANAYGEEAVKYIDQYLKDLNSGIKADPKERIVSGLVSRFKKISVVASLSVIIQQPTSIVRAFAEINPTYLVLGEKLDRMSHAEAWEELQKYAGVATIKEIGGFDTGTTGSAVDYILDREDSLKRKVGDFIAKNTKLERVGNAIGHAQSLAARADESTWIAIWKACQREQAALHPELKGEALKKAAGERFTEVVNLTQVYDSTLAKSQHMRSKNMMMTMLTAFMAEPTTSINMLERGARLFMRGERKKAVRMMTSVWTASIFTAVASSIVYAMRDDDEDETFWEKYFSSVAVETIDNLNPLTSLPIIKDAWSIVQGYDVERIDMSLFSDFYNAFTKAKRIREKDIEGMTEAELEKHYKDMRNADLDVVAMGASLLGTSAKNVIRELRAVENVISTVWKDLTVEGRDTSPRSVIDRIQTDLGSSWNISPSSGFQLIAEEGKNEQLYEAIVAGDGKYVARLKSSYEDETAYKLAVRKALKENDPRIKQAAEARVKGDITAKNKLLEEIVGEGHFSKDMVNQAINNAQNDITRDAVELLRTTDDRIGQAAALEESDSEYQRIVNAIVREGEYSRETVVKAINTQKGEIEDEEKDEVYSIFDASDVNAAYESGDEDLAHEIIDDLIATKVAGGKKEEEARSSVRSSMTRYWKKLYKAAYDSGDTEECERIEDILADSGLYGRPKELRKTLKGWRKDDEEEE